MRKDYANIRLTTKSHACDQCTIQSAGPIHTSLLQPGQTGNDKANRSFSDVSNALKQQASLFKLPTTGPLYRLLSEPRASMINTRCKAPPKCWHLHHSHVLQKAQQVNKHCEYKHCQLSAAHYRQIYVCLKSHNQVSHLKWCCGRLQDHHMKQA